MFCIFQLFLGMFVRPNHIVAVDDETGSNRGSDSPTPGNSPSKDKSPNQVISSYNSLESGK